MSNKIVTNIGQNWDGHGMKLGQTSDRTAMDVRQNRTTMDIGWNGWQLHR